MAQFCSRRHNAQLPLTGAKHLHSNEQQCEALLGAESMGNLSMGLANSSLMLVPYCTGEIVWCAPEKAAALKSTFAQ